MDISHVPFEVAFEVVVANVACCVTFHVKVRFCNGIEFLLAYFADLVFSFWFPVMFRVGYDLFNS